ncbi:scarecrow-like protein 18 [Magnolia sinica]|uniref:scarecrow-like protein 18 n=1 Tax=Magnolia sinica TaxID=86752 RepID=UPI002658A3B8|nr:scarecrow-like protein 18 [Magnolia sinica]
MEYALLPFGAFDCNGVENFHISLLGFEREEEEEDTKGSGGMDYVYTDNLFGYDYNEERYFDRMCSYMSSAEIQSLEEPVKLNTGLDCNQKLSNAKDRELLETSEKASSTYLSSLDILNRYRTDRTISNADKRSELPSEASCNYQLSTEEVMRVAGARFIQFSGHADENLSLLTHPFSSLFSGLMDEDVKNVELVQLLLSSAEKIGHRQYERARKLLTQCSDRSSSTGNPVERVVHYFMEALQERIDREMGELKGSTIKARLGENVEEAILSLHPAFLAFHQLFPFSQVLQFTAIQVIIDNVASATRVHLIDLGIRVGIHWTILMQALAVRSTHRIELLKISAVGTLRDKIEETGKHLVSFAETLNLPFAFNAVIVSDVSDIDEDRFGLETGEVVCVHIPCILRKLIFRPDGLKKLMRLIRNLNPCVMTVTEVQGNHNSTSFINRFTEALFFYGAWFDCIGMSMAGNSGDRLHIEGNFFRQGIQSMVVREGTERVIRHVGIDMWRSFFAQYEFVEAELGQRALYQARLIVNKFACGNYCTLDMKGKCLTIGWKGTPLFSVSAWKLNW